MLNIEELSYWEKTKQELFPTFNPWKTRAAKVQSLDDSLEVLINYVSVTPLIGRGNISNQWQRSKQRSDDFTREIFL